MNPGNTMKLLAAVNKFQQTHPKFFAFLRTMSSGSIKEGTVIEITVTRPGEEPVTTNMRVQASDLELLEELKSMSPR